MCIRLTYVVFLFHLAPPPPLHLGVLGGPRVVLPLRNGEVAQEGISTAMLGTDGTTAEGFAEMVSARFPGTRVVFPEPGVAVEVEVET